MITVKKTITVLLCLIFAVVAVFIESTSTTFALDSDISSNNYSVNDSTGRVSYEDYKSYASEFQSAENDLTILADDIEQGSTVKLIDQELFGENNGVVFEKTGDKAIYTFSVQQDGVYNIKFNYAGIKNTTMDIQFALYIDGQLLWSELENVKLYRWWKDSNDEWEVDRSGNEVAPEQEESFGFREQYLVDDTGIETDYYRFVFKKGVHTIECVTSQEPFALKSITLVPIKNLKKADSIIENQNAVNYTGNDIIIQGEDALEKNAFSLTAKSDSLSAEVVPQSPYKNVVNYIGSTTWDTPWQTIKWSVKVKKSAFYKLGFHFKQSGVVNSNVYRRLIIDGETPFSEAEAIAFPYDSGWQYATLDDENGNACKIYLEEGMHTIELSVSLGPTAEYINRLQKIIKVIGDEYLRISMITGENPDKNRDYDLFDQIPDLEEQFKWCKNQLDSLSDIMVKSANNESSQYVTTLKETIRVLEQMLAKKYLAHTYKSDYYTQYTNLSSIVYEMQSMPLSIDEIRFMAPDSNDPEYAGITEKIKYTILSFFSSFTRDYDMAHSSKGNITATLKIWTTWGRDQTQVLNSLIAESFTPKYGIDVDVQITSATLIEGILTKNAPDLSLGLPRSSPVNFALRGALYNLSGFDDIDEVLTRFNKGAADAYYYKGDCYALPDTQTFYIMFYRSDVLEELGISIPNTWDEFVEAAAIIQRHNMNVYLPDSAGLTFLSTILRQNDIDVYNQDLTANLLDQNDALSVFEWWTDLYKDYNFPVTSDFYNRFRIGVTPLGIAPYTVYTQLTQTATDIKGRWGIALVPGTMDTNGNINRSIADSGTGCAIINDSKHKDEAWTFLKWWTSADIQYRYSKNLETLLGAVGRVATSNMEAFSNFAWNEGDAAILLKQWESVFSLQELPGSYYMTRSVEQAFLSAVNGKSSAVDALIRWSEIANDEITRKIKEYS